MTSFAQRFNVRLNLVSKNVALAFPAKPQMTPLHLLNISKLNLCSIIQKYYSYVHVFFVIK